MASLLVFTSGFVDIQCWDCGLLQDPTQRAFCKDLLLENCSSVDPEGEKNLLAVSSWKTALCVFELCVNESHILESKVKSLEKGTFVLIFSLSFMFILLSGVSNFHFCSMKSSRCFLKNLCVLCSSHIAQLDLLTCEAEQSPGWRRERRQ